MLAECRERLGVPGRPAATRDQRVQRRARGILDHRFQSAVGRGGERERQLRPELTGHPVARRGNGEPQQPPGPAGHRHGLLARGLADPDSDRVAFVDERREAAQADPAQVDRARQRVDVEVAHPMAREGRHRVLQARLQRRPQLIAQRVEGPARREHRPVLVLDREGHPQVRGQIVQ